MWKGQESRALGQCGPAPRPCRYPGPLSPGTRLPLRSSHPCPRWPWRTPPCLTLHSESSLALRASPPIICAGAEGPAGHGACGLESLRPGEAQEGQSRGYILSARLHPWGPQSHPRELAWPLPSQQSRGAGGRQLGQRQMGSLMTPDKKQLVLPHSGGCQPGLPGSARPAPSPLQGSHCGLWNQAAPAVAPAPAVRSCLNTLCLGFPINTEGVVVWMLRAFCDMHR